MYSATFRATDDDLGAVQQTIQVTVQEACAAAIAVTNRNDDTVSLIDAETNTVKAILRSGHKPLAASFFDLFSETDSLSAKLYVANRNDDTVSVYRQPTLGTGIDPFALEGIKTVGVGQKPEGVAVSPDGKYVWVTNRNDDTISILDRATDQVLVTVPLGKKGGSSTSTYSGEAEKPVDIGFAPDGSRAYVTARNSNDLLVLDTAKALTDPANAVIATVPVGNKPVALAVAPSGKVIYVVNRSGNSLSVVDATALNVLTTIPVGSEPEGVAVTSDGTKAYVTSSKTNEVWVLQVHAGSPYLQELRRVAVGRRPTGIATTPAETGLQRAYVANRDDNTISVIDTTNDSIIATIPVGNGPVGIAAGIVRTR
jgi:YVTN family beta-propeller protein